MLRTLIIDDESKSRQSLESLLTSYCTGVEVIGLATGVEDGISYIEKHHPDLVMLDIQMQDGTGFDLLKQIDTPAFQLIFTTAFDEYAIKAFKFSAIDYLLKPIDVCELEAAIERAKLINKNKTEHHTFDPLIKNLLAYSEVDLRITVSTEQALEILPVAEIVRLESDNTYTHIVMKDGRRILSSKHLKHYDAMLEGQPFMRVHNSHIINLNSVTRFLKSDGGFIGLVNGDKIPISRRRKDHFLDLYKGG
jgi:two-component system, LytTR family, response regulator